MDDLDKITEIALEVRKRMVERHGYSEGHCDVWSNELWHQLNKVGIKAKVVSGTYVDECAEYFVITRFGREKKHRTSYIKHKWVETKDYMIDITADQFGCEEYGHPKEIVIFPKEDLNSDYRYLSSSCNKLRRK